MAHLSGFKQHNFLVLFLNYNGFVSDCDPLSRLVWLSGAPLWNFEVLAN